MLSAYRCFDAVLKALAQAVPDRVIAGGNDSTHSLAFSHLSGGRYRVYLEIYGGGFGASPRVDGCDGVDSALSNCTNTPIEATDMDFPHFRVIGYGMVPDSGGAGRRRGGCGLWRSFEALTDGVNFACYSDRMRLAPFGLFGGADGARTRIELRRGDEVIDLPSKTQITLNKGDVLTIFTAGGGGYGPADERPGAMIAADLHQGLLSEPAARAAYGRTG
jgi:N-methylhydantoinase B